METPEAILDFWFGAAADDAATIAAKSRLWWGKDRRADGLVRRRFEPTLLAAAGGAMGAWNSSAPGRLAFVILCDQFPRNMYRGSARAFAFDALARACCVEGLAAGADRRLRPVERVFFYLPLEHSERLDDQDRSLALFTELAQGAPAGLRAAFDGYLDYARRHRQVIARFGRFPHRNRALGRESTPEEAAFLARPGSAF